ncbi:signal recognition particle 19 kDa protein isoform X1 [Apodemus sylvaticus]|nr:signal recognition particle 19 kDa protein isoform X1 [Apodemus sylvaticus]
MNVRPQIGRASSLSLSNTPVLGVQFNSNCSKQDFLAQAPLTVFVLKVYSTYAVENPTATEIQDVCSAVGLNAFLEKNKMYSREWNRDVQYRGRVRVQLRQEDGSLCLGQFPSRKSVMLYVAEMIPKLKTRTQKSGGADPSLQQGEGSKKGKGKKKK